MSDAAALERLREAKSMGEVYGEVVAIAQKSRTGSGPATHYFELHQYRVYAAIHARLQSSRLPQPHPQLTWTAAALPFAKAVASVNGGSDFRLSRLLPALLQPVDPWRLIDLHRELVAGKPGAVENGKPAQGTLEWSDVAGEAIALEIEARLRESLPRMGARYAGQADEHDEVTASSLVTSHPFDQITAHLLCDFGSVHRTPSVARANKRGSQPSPNVFANGIRALAFEWLPEAKLWNWVKMAAPDATREEVSAAVFARDGVLGPTHHAHAITPVPPYFAIAPELAKTVSPNAASASSTDDRGAIELVSSSRADDAALTQGTGREHRDRAGHLLPADRQAVHRSLDLNARHLVLIGEQLQPWGLLDLVEPARAWTTRRLDALIGDDDRTVQQWTPVVEGQRSLLHRTGGDISEIFQMAGRIQQDSPSANSVRQVLRALAIAAGQAHLLDAGEQQLAVARHAKAMLPITLLDLSLRESRNAAADYRATKPDRVNGVDLAAGADATQVGLERQLLEARRKLLSGEEVDQTAITGLAVTAAQESMTLRAKTLAQHVLQLEAAIQPDGFLSGASNIDRATEIQQKRGKLREIRLAASAVADSFRARVIAATSDSAAPTDPKAFQGWLLDVRRAAVDDGNRALARLGEDPETKQLFQEVLDLAQLIEIRTQVIEAALLIGISLVATAAAGYIGGVVRGSILAGDAVSMTTTRAVAGQFLGAATTVAVDAGLNAAGQALISGDGFGSAFVENLLANAIVSTALRPLHAAVASWGKLDETAMGLWKTVDHGRVIAVKGASVSADLVVAAAGSYVAHRILNGEPPTEAQAVDWAMQGATMAVGQLLAHHLGGLQERLAHLGELGAHLRKRAAKQQQLARELEKTRDADAARDLLSDHQQLLRREAELLADPDTVRRLKLDPRQLATLVEGNRAATSNSTNRELRWGLLGLQPLDETRTRFSGPPNAIHQQLEELAANGEAKDIRFDRANRRWTAEIDGHRLTFLETEPRPHEISKPDLPELESRAWAKAAAQGDALRSLQHGEATKEDRHLIASEIERQLPGVALSMAVAEHNAKTVIAIVTPGSGPTGIKTLNDKLVGHALTDKLLSVRNQVFRDVFAKHGMTVVGDDYKTTTVVSNKSAAELRVELHRALLEFDIAMRPKFQQVLEEGVEYWKVQRATREPGTDLAKAAGERLERIQALLARGKDLSFEIQLGAAEIGEAKPGYQAILDTQMNATKAAIMARDPAAIRGTSMDAGDSRAAIYSEDQFRKFADGTMALRHELAGLTLPWNGRRRPVVQADGALDRTLAGLARKDELTFEATDDAAAQNQLTEDKQTLAKLKGYLTRINALDYITQHQSDETTAYGKQVGHAIEMVKALRSDQALTREVVAGADAVLEGPPKSGIASEARFFERAAHSRDRLVLNADIKDLGVDVMEGNAREMARIAKGTEVGSASRKASDEILKMKRHIVEDMDRYYRSELLPEARRQIAIQHRNDLFPLLELEREPLFLLGGDEITISIPRVFGDLGVVPGLVNHLQAKVRARVAITRTGTGDGARGHESAMKASEPAHQTLKELEGFARRLADAKERLPRDEAKHAEILEGYFNRLYTSVDDRGVTVIMESGRPAAGLENAKNQALKLLHPGDSK